MLSRYTTEPYTGNGCFSTLLKGIHKIKKHKVILKTHYDEASKKILENEIRIYMYLNKSNYDYVPYIKNIIRENNQLYMIMDYKSEPFSLSPNYKEKIDSLIEVVVSLHSLHVVHRDLKPDNFLIDKGKIYIIDFGLSTFYNDTPLNHLIGNKKYCSLSCHRPPYIYTYKDDLISLVYMCLDLYNGYIPWKEDYTIKQNVKPYYKDDPINAYLFTLFERYLSEW
jgi:serine/threonine protein kinase